VAGEKSEQPTPQKLKKARQEGQIGRTQDIGAWVGMLAASIVLPRNPATASAGLAANPVARSSA